MKPARTDFFWVRPPVLVFFLFRDCCGPPLATLLFLPPVTCLDPYVTFARHSAPDNPGKFPVTFSATERPAINSFQICRLTPRIVSYLSVVTTNRNITRDRPSFLRLTMACAGFFSFRCFPFGYLRIFSFSCCPQDPL